MNRLIKVLTAINAFIFMLSAIALDSDSLLPFIALCISGAWLTVYYFVFEEGRVR